MPTSARPTALLAPLRRGRHPQRPEPPHPLSRKMPPAAPFLSAAKEREERTPPKPMVLESLRGRGAGSIGTFRSPRINPCKRALCFRIASASIHRDALRACAAHPNRDNMCVYRGAGQSPAPTKFYRQTLRRGGVLPHPFGLVPQLLCLRRGGRPCPPAGLVPHFL